MQCSLVLMLETEARQSGDPGVATGIAIAKFAQMNKLQQHEAGAKSGKRPYVKPAFEYERVFETMALACGKISQTQLSCHTVRKTS